MSSTISQDAPQVVIVGAGFGGLWAAKALRGDSVRVQLIDKNNYHSFYPLLYQVAAAEVEPELIAQPVRRIVRNQPNVRFAMLDVQHVDTERQVVSGPDQEFHYDYLILALGSTNFFFNTPGAAEHSFTLKSIEEGTVLRNHILQCVEDAAKLPPQAAEERQRLLTFVIVGGGPTGVEFAGALAELLYEPLAKDYRDLDLKGEARVILVEAMDALLRGVGGDEYVQRQLHSMGVEVRVNCPVERIERGAVVLAGGERVLTATPVWTAGVTGVGLAVEPQLERVRGGRIPVRRTLQTLAHDNVFVIGDLAWLEQDGAMLPGVAQVAMQEGEQAARNILRLAAGEQPQPFRYRDKGAMATVGRNAAVARIGGRLFTGFLAWLIWLAVHIFFLIGFRNRAAVLLNWAWNYLFYERSVRLILPKRTSGQ
jgi:NADH dehydrogenase